MTKRRTSRRRTSRRPAAAKRRTSRSLRPNVKCPNCGSTDYFEGLTTRDCATPECIYYRGGTATGVAPPTPRSGRRVLHVTSETVHSSEPDEYPEIDNEQDEDIVIEADDLDEDETFADRAAKIIAEELGYVEGSDSGRKPRWYTQSDATEDYSTGESTRRSIHPDTGTWTDEELRDIYDELKRRRMVSNRRPAKAKRRTSRSVRSNAIPPPPDTRAALLAWAQRTYAPGTPVRFTGGGVSWNLGGDPPTSKASDTVLVPDETRGVVRKVARYDEPYGGVYVVVEVHDARSYAWYAAAPSGEAKGWMEQDIHDMWTRLDVAHTNLVARYLSGNALQWLEPLDDNWLAAPAPAKRGSLPTSQRGLSMKHRRLRPNPPPTKPRIFTGPWIQWYQTTFAPGTPVAFREVIRVRRGADLLEAAPGARGRVRDISVPSISQASVTVEVVDARDAAGVPIHDLRGRLFQYMLERPPEDYIIPLVDNWAAAPSKPLPHHALPRSQKRSWKAVRPNPIPPPPSGLGSGMYAIDRWAERTYAPGTAVKLLREKPYYLGASADVAGYVGPGTKGESHGADEYGVEVGWLPSYQIPVGAYSVIGYAYGDDSKILDHLEPLDDNWGSLVVRAPKRYARPRP